jgi:hypothetical protein
VDRDAYVLCVLEQLHRALRVRDVYATPSQRWGVVFHIKWHLSFELFGILTAG